MNKKIPRHLLFWLVTFIQGTVLEYAWIHTMFSHQTTGAIIGKAMNFNLAFMPARLFFTYIALYEITRRSLRKDTNRWLEVLRLAIALVAAILLHRLATAYYIAPQEYPGHAAYTWQQVLSPPWMLYAMLDIGYVAGIAVALKLFRMQATSLEYEKELNRQKLETELKYLKNQINPHFLFNTLNAVYALARKRSEETPNVVIRLSNLLRYMLYQSSNRWIPIFEELKIIDNYVELEKMRFSNHLEVCFTKDIDNFDEVISPLILLPFIENAFKHGVNDSLEDTYIIIKAVLKEGHLHFMVKNPLHGGMEAQTTEKIGLQNVRRQLELTYSDFYLNIANLEDSFVVDLTINLHSNGKI